MLFNYNDIILEKNFSRAVVMSHRDSDHYLIFVYDICKNYMLSVAYACSEKYGIYDNDGILSGVSLHKGNYFSFSPSECILNSENSSNTINYSLIDKDSLRYIKKLSEGCYLMYRLGRNPEYKLLKDVINL